MTKEEFLNLSDEQKWNVFDSANAACQEAKDNSDRNWKWYKEEKDKSESMKNTLENLKVAVKALSQCV